MLKLPFWFGDCIEEMIHSWFMSFMELQLLLSRLLPSFRALPRPVLSGNFQSAAFHKSVIHWGSLYLVWSNQRKAAFLSTEFWTAIWLGACCSLSFTPRSFFGSSRKQRLTSVKFIEMFKKVTPQKFLSSYYFTSLDQAHNWLTLPFSPVDNDDGPDWAEQTGWWVVCLLPYTNCLFMLFIIKKFSLYLFIWHKSYFIDNRIRLKGEWSPYIWKKNGIQEVQSLSRKLKTTTAKVKEWWSRTVKIFG